MPPSRSTNLGCEVEVGVMFQQHAGHLLVPLLGGDVQRRVQVLRHRVGLRAMLEQEHHVVNVTETGSDVQGRLVFLTTEDRLLVKSKVYKL